MFHHRGLTKDAFRSWLAGEQVHLFAAACHGGPCPLKPQVLGSKWGMCVEIGRHGKS